MGVSSWSAHLAALTSLEATVAMSIALAVLAVPQSAVPRPRHASHSAEVRYFQLLGTATRRVARNPGCGR
jgi:hypothetical protein